MSKCPTYVFSYVYIYTHICITSQTKFNTTTFSSKVGRNPLIQISNSIKEKDKKQSHKSKQWLIGQQKMQQRPISTL
jgi:hypothetical protein